MPNPSLPNYGDGEKRNSGESDQSFHDHNEKTRKNAEGDGRVSTSRTLAGGTALQPVMAENSQAKIALRPSGTKLASWGVMCSVMLPRNKWKRHS